MRRRMQALKSATESILKKLTPQIQANERF